LGLKTGHPRSSPYYGNEKQRIVQWSREFGDSRVFAYILSRGREDAAIGEQERHSGEPVGAKERRSWRKKETLEGRRDGSVMGE